MQTLLFFSFWQAYQREILAGGKSKHCLSEWYFKVSPFLAAFGTKLCGEQMIQT